MTEFYGERPTVVRWRIVSLLAAFSLVSYALRTNISVAAKFMMSDLGITQIQMGQVFSAFMLGYTIFQVPAGILGDRFGSRRVLAAAAVLWGVATLLTGALPGVALGGTGALFVLIAVRFALGAAEAATYPVAARAVGLWMPLSERAFANSLVFAGMALGSACIGPVIAWLMVTQGWRTAFVVTSTLGFLIAGLWWSYATDSPSEHPAINDVERRLVAAGNPDGDAPSHRDGIARTWWALLADRNVALISASYFLSSHVLFIFVFWFYLYLVEERRFSVLSGGFFSSLPWIISLVLVPIGGRACDVLTMRWGPRWGRRAIVIGVLAVSSALLAWGVTVQDPYLAITALSVSVGFLMCTEAVFWSSAIDVAGPSAGTVGGIMNTAGNLGGVVSTSLVPVLVAQLGWVLALGSGALLAALSALLWLIIRVDAVGPSAGPIPPVRVAAVAAQEGRS